MEDSHVVQMELQVVQVVELAVAAAVVVVIPPTTPSQGNSGNAAPTFPAIGVGGGVELPAEVIMEQPSGGAGGDGAGTGTSPTGGTQDQVVH